MEYTQLTIAKLLEYQPKEKILASTYILAGNVLIRLFNSKEHKATVPALFPNLLKLKQQFKYDNVKPHRHDYIQGKMTGNRKVDLVIDNPYEVTTTLEITLEDLAHDNNSTNL